MQVEGVVEAEAEAEEKVHYREKKRRVEMRRKKKESGRKRCRRSYFPVTLIFTAGTPFINMREECALLKTRLYFQESGSKFFLLRRLFLYANS